MKRFDFVEAKKELEKKMNDFSIDFAGDNSLAFNTAYICDAISEYADSAVSIYYSDIEKFMANNIEAVNDAIAEFGWDGCGADLYKAGQMAEFLENERILYGDLDSIVKWLALDFLEDVRPEMTGDEWEAVADALESIDSGDRFDDICDAINDALAEFETDQEPAENPVAGVLKKVAENVAGAAADDLESVTA